MKRLLGLLLLLAIAGGVLELAAPSWVERRSEAAISAATDGRLAADVTVSGPPLLLPVAATGRISRWSVRLREAGASQLPVQVTVDLRDLRLDRRQLLGGQIVVTDVGRASIVLQVDLAGALPGLGGLTDQLSDQGLDQLLEAMGTGAVTRDDGALVIAGVVLPIVDGSCGVDTAGLVVTVSCELDGIPDVLLDAVAG